MLSMSELEAHQTIYLILGFASGACLASFFLTSNPFFVIVNFVLLNKIMIKMQDIPILKLIQKRKFIELKKK